MTKNFHPSKTCLLIAILISSFALAGKAKAGLLYDIIDLGTLGGNSSYGYAINASGQVTGKAETADGYFHAFVTDQNGVMKDLGTLGGGYTSSEGWGINSTGQVVGDSFSPTNFGTHAFITNSSGVMVDLGIALESSAAYGINESGQVTGRSNRIAFVTNSSGVKTSLGTLGHDRSSWGSAINAFGQITGGGFINFNEYHAFISNGSGGLTDLGTLGGNSSEGLDINDSGLVTGGSKTVDGIHHAFITDSSRRLIDLGSLNGSSYGYSINNAGQVVGQFGTETQWDASEDSRAFVIEGGEMKDLNTLLVSSATGWILNGAFANNDNGQITGVGTHNGVIRAFLLTPTSVPVPSAIWMMVSGLLGLLGFNKRCRANV